jgi:uncharacterized Zn-finger protein
MGKLATHNKVKLSRTKLKWFRCDQCEYKCRQKGNLTRHKLAQHTPADEIKWFKCDECEYKAKLNSNLTRHKLAQHTPIDETLWFKCDTRPSMK